MKNLIRLVLLSLFFLGMLLQCTQPGRSPHPNVIIIYADDLGYGELSSYGATEIITPNIDRIAGEGIKFTNGYASSATCTPSRYALLTGLYPWRNKQARVLRGNAPLIIDTSLTTLPDIFSNAGYTTAVIGKWHLGLGADNLDWNGIIYPGPNDIGFDYSYILASTNDRTPTVYVENDRVVGLNKNDPLEVNYVNNFPGEPTGKDNPELLKLHPSHGHDMSIHNGISRIGFMRGGKSALWIDENMADTILNRTLSFIESNKNNPFFLFYSLHQPHVPRTPHPRFVGSTDMGPRGDVIMEIDYAVGQVLELLESLGLDEQTMIIFSSDNGPVLDDGYRDESDTRIGSHKPSGILRGGKYSLFDAGTHVPFMIRWPGNIKPGVSGALVSQIDLYSSLASLIGQENSTPDSENIIDALTGKSQVGRTDIVLEAIGKTSYRNGNWVMIPPYEGSAKISWGPDIESGRSNQYQLYDLDSDPSQQNNLADNEPGKLEELIVKYEKIIYQE